MGEKGLVPSILDGESWSDFTNPVNYEEVHCQVILAAKEYDFEILVGRDQQEGMPTAYYVEMYDDFTGQRYPFGPVSSFMDTLRFIRDTLLSEVVA